MENLHSAATREHAFSIDHDRYRHGHRHTNWREWGSAWGVFDYVFDVFEQVNGVQSALKS